MKKTRNVFRVLRRLSQQHDILQRYNWYIIYTKPISKIKNDVAYHWLCNNISNKKGNRYRCFYYKIDTYMIYFENKNDALKFKLAFADILKNGECI